MTYVKSFISLLHILTITRGSAIKIRLDKMPVSSVSFCTIEDLATLPLCVLLSRR